jgi:hypothetical protein
MWAAVASAATFDAVMRRIDDLAAPHVDGGGAPATTAGSSSTLDAAAWLKGTAELSGWTPWPVRWPTDGGAAEQDDRGESSDDGKVDAEAVAAEMAALDQAVAADDATKLTAAQRKAARLTAAKKARLAAKPDGAVPMTNVASSIVTGAMDSWKDSQMTLERSHSILADAPGAVKRPREDAEVVADGSDDDDGTAGVLRRRRTQGGEAGDEAAETERRRRRQQGYLDRQRFADEASQREEQRNHDAARHDAERRARAKR